ncbi:MAG: DUF2924 domain-containing protein [Phycisphaerae bacterium]|nr:DUF2924 domain-containing protein [Phycisphaerae bacterium]
MFGEPSRSRHRRYLIHRIAWRLQADAEGGLTDRALQRAAELANDPDVRVTPPRHGATRPLVLPRRPRPKASPSMLITCFA